MADGFWSPELVFDMRSLAGYGAGVKDGVVAAYGLKQDGTLLAWRGHLDGSQYAGARWHEPVQVPDLDEVTSVACLQHSAHALKADGTVWRLGDVGYGEFETTPADQTKPIPVAGLDRVTALESSLGRGGIATYALRSDGTVWAWGSNLEGQLGDGTTTDRQDPVRVRDLTGITSIATAEGRAYARAADGSMWAWGRNHKGQLGDGTTTARHAPVRVSGLTDVVSMTTGAISTFAVKSDGTVWAWGFNTRSGQLGDGTTSDRHTPVRVVGLTGVMSLVVIEDSGYALTSDGSVWAWGDFDIWHHDRASTTPVRLPGMNGIAAIEAQGNQFVAMRADGTIWAWGRDGLEQVAAR